MSRPLRTHTTEASPFQVAALRTGEKRFMLLPERTTVINCGDTVEVRQFFRGEEGVWRGTIVYIESGTGLERDYCCVGVVPLGEPVPCHAA